GAYHLSCAGTDVHVLSDSALAPGFLTAEIVEVFEAALNNGWDCGVTNGESLSRVLAFDRHPEIAGDFNQTEQDWWASGHPDHGGTLALPPSGNPFPVKTSRTQ